MKKRTPTAPIEARAGHVHIAVRLDPALVTLLDGLVPGLSSTWHRATRSDAVRYVIVEGLRAIDAKKRAAKKGGAR